MAIKSKNRRKRARAFARGLNEQRDEAPVRVWFDPAVRRRGVSAYRITEGNRSGTQAQDVARTTGQAR